jgi:hypothetical protein
MLIRKAERKKAKLRLGISGTSGSGKTWSALEIAKGMGGKIGMIDTEAGRGELYGNDFDYDIIRLDAPYSPDRYIEAMKAFEKAGYDILIIDSLSHAWVGEGGVLSIVDRAGSDKFTSGWKTATPMQNALVDALITSKMHIITTLRVKTEYIIEMNSKGKNAPKKVGMAPVQRDGLEYEFTVFMDMNGDGHIAHVTKDNTKMFDQQYIKPSADMGAKLMEWLNTGIDVKDYFKSTVIPQLLENIADTHDEVELREVYTKMWKSYQASYPEEFKMITEAKEKHKSVLAQFERIAERNVATNVPAGVTQ